MAYRRRHAEAPMGVPIFQEQVMQVAMLAAGFSAGKANQLRRAMAACKRKGGLQHFHDRIVEGNAAARVQPRIGRIHFCADSGLW
jgi:DNA polymerase III alpha subunit